MSADGRCVVCGSETCTHAPPVDYLDTYPFMPGGRPRVPGIAGRDFVYAPHAVYDEALGRCVYGAQDPVPMADAVRYGLVPGPEPEPEQAPVKGKRRPRRDRAHRPAEDRGAA